MIINVISDITDFSGFGPLMLIIRLLEMLNFFYCSIYFSPQCTDIHDQGTGLSTNLVFPPLNTK